MIAEYRDRAFDCGAASLLLLHRIALQLGLPPLGDIFVRGDPAAVFDRMIGNQQETPTLGLHLVRDGAPLSNCSQKFLSVLIWMPGKRALGDPLFQHLGKRGSRLNIGQCQLIHVLVLRVADDQPLGSVNMHSPCAMLLMAVRICSFSRF